MSVVLLSDLRVHLNRADTADGTELQAMLDAAEAYITHWCGPLGVAASTLTVWSDGMTCLLVVGGTRLASVVQVRDPVNTVVTLSGVGSTNLAAGIVRVPYPMAGAWQVDVTRSATLPADLRQAILILAGHLWETQRVTTPGGPPGFRPGEAPVGASPGYAIPNRVSDLMRAYVTPAVA